MDAAGVDTDGKVYQNPQQFWDVLKKQTKPAEQTAAPTAATTANNNDNSDGPVWYKAAVEYWDNQEASDNGVLGGFGTVSTIDVRDSRLFLEKAIKKLLDESEAGDRTLVALDCGAGVGRVSELFLLHKFKEVDLVEPSAHLIKAAKKRLTSNKGERPFPKHHKAVNYYQCGLEEFDPEPQRYDVIWVQWAMLYLTDEDAVSFLKRCAAALKPGGKIFVKENVCDVGFLVDNDDASLTRSHEYYTELFTKHAGLMVTHTAVQKGFPRQLFKVRMYALKPEPVVV